RVRVASVFALLTHHNACLRALGGKASKCFRAVLFFANAWASSGCISKASTASSAVHEPLALATSMALSPAVVIRLPAMSRSTRSLFTLLQTLFGLRGHTRINDRSWSNGRAVA